MKTLKFSDKDTNTCVPTNFTVADDDVQLYGELGIANVALECGDVVNGYLTRKTAKALRDWLTARLAETAPKRRPVKKAKAKR